MIVLPTTSDKLRMITVTGADFDVHASFVDGPTGGIGSSSSLTPEDQDTAITSAGTTDIVAVPGSSTVRNIKHLSVRNIDATLSDTVTITKYNGSTDKQLFKCTLGVGEGLVFADGTWFVYDAYGGVKSGSTAAATTTVKALTADQSNSTTTPTEVTGLSVQLEPGTFMFRYLIRYQSAATTTGVRFSANHSGTVTSFLQNLYWVDNSATAATAAADQDAVGAAGQVLGAMAGRAKSTAGLGTTISVDTANADMLAILEGMCVVTVAGELELWHGSEVAAASTVMAGSCVQITKCG